MTDANSAKKRRYRGVDADQRLAERRARLLEAGLELFGTAGWANTSVEDVCRMGATQLVGAVTELVKDQVLAR